MDTFVLPCFAHLSFDIIANLIVKSTNSKNIWKIKKVSFPYYIQRKMIIWSILFLVCFSIVSADITVNKTKYKTVNKTGNITEVDLNRKFYTF